MLSLAQITDVCLAYGGSKQCRYLQNDDDDFHKWYCKKQSPDGVYHDELTRDYINQCIAEGKNPELGHEPIGDNCAGFPPFKDMLQGYDI